MRKQGAILVLAVFLAVILCGAVSAAGSSTTGGVNVTAKNSSKSVVDPVIGVKVNYEYSFDKNINPTIVVRDSKGSIIKVTKTYDYALNSGYRVNFDYPGVVNGTKFRVTLSAPGYVTQSQTIAVFQHDVDPNFYGSSTFNMKARMNYKLGKEVTSRADGLLKFKDADGVLCITTAGLVYRNGYTTEDTLEGILNRSFGKISYGKGNLLTFQSTRVDPLDFCFVVRKGSSLTAAFFKNGSLKPVYVGSFSAINQKLWDKTIKPKLGDKAYGYVSLANAWKDGLSTDILRQAAYHGHVCLGTISGQAMVSLLLKYYPPGVYGDDGELEATSYRAISVPGNSDDDAFIYSLDLTTGKRSWVGYNTDKDNMVGFIRWCASTKLGTLIIMRFNEDAVVKLFKKETGIKAYSGIASELKFNKWLINKLEKDPDSLVEILYAFDKITPAIHNNLTGGVDSKKVVCDAKGLDMKYILGLGLTNIANKRVATNYKTGSLTTAQIKQIGIDAAKMAKKLFAADGINLEKDSSKLTVFTTAGYVRVNEQVMDMTMDGIYEILGSRLSRATLLPVHNARYNPLYFQFSLEKDGKVISKTIYYTYNETTKKWGLIAQKKSACSIEGVLLYDPPYDALMAWLWHNHICGGSSPGYLITNYIYKNYPLGDGESYSLIGNSISCRDDIYSYLLGISAGAGTLYSQRMTKDSTGQDILVLSIYDRKTNTRRVVIINWENPKFQGDYDPYEEYIKLYWGDYTSPHLKSPPKISITADTYVTEAEWNRIISGDALNIVKGIHRTKEELIRIQGGSETPNGGSETPNGGSETPNGGSTSQGTGSSSSANGSSRFSMGSVGYTGAKVIAATMTAATVGALPSDDSEKPSDSGKTYEVSKTTSEGSGDSPWGVAAIVGVLAVLGLGAIGFLFKGSLFGR